jgi:hypothetical protein
LTHTLLLPSFLLSFLPLFKIRSSAFAGVIRLHFGVCLYICVYICRAHVHMYDTHTYMPYQPYIFVCTHIIYKIFALYICVFYIHIYIYIYIYIYMYMCTCMYVHVCIVYMPNPILHTYTCMHICTHTYIYIYI